MARCIAALFSAMMALSVAFTSSALDVPLGYVRHAGRWSSSQGVTELDKTTRRPVGPWRMPELRSKRPVFAFVHLGGEKRLLILDGPDTPGFSYNRLYFDSNGNNDLTDDPVVGLLRSTYRSYWTAEFPTIDAIIRVGDAQAPYSFRVRARYFGSLRQEPSADTFERNLTLNMVPNCLYEGEFELDGRMYRVVLSDMNCNGQFSDRWYRKEDFGPKHRTPSGGDLFCIAADGMIKPDRTQVFGDRLFLNGTLYDVTVTVAEQKMILTPARDPVAKLSLSMEVERMTLSSDDGSHSIVTYRPGKEVMVPPGTYRLLNYHALRKDAQNDLWLLRAAVTQDTPRVTVNTDGSSVLTFGEPYVPSAVVRNATVERGTSGRILTWLEFQIEGGGKETVSELSRVSGHLSRLPLSRTQRNLPKEPTYKIVKYDGEVVGSGSFEYG